MEISISGKNTDTGGAFQQHAHTALSGAVSKYFERAVSGAITLEKGPAGFETRIRVNLTNRIEMEATGRANDAHISLDEAVEHIEKRLRRFKRRLKNHRHEPAGEVIAATVTVFAPGDDEAERDGPIDTDQSPAVLAEMDYDIHLMTVEEAVMVFELSGKPALMFRNKSHLGLNMLYRRDDDSIGWVDPRGNRS